VKVENLPAELVRLLTALGHDTDTVPQEGLAGRPDTDIWAAAQTAERFLITQDRTFPTSAASRQELMQASYWFGFALPAATG
jgi:predicted nuclease of predicted toxin-antitoxin system